MVGRGFGAAFVVVSVGVVACSGNESGGRLEEGTGGGSASGGTSASGGAAGSGGSAGIGGGAGGASAGGTAGSNGGSAGGGGSPSAGGVVNTNVPPEWTDVDLSDPPPAMPNPMGAPVPLAGRWALVANRTGSTIEETSILDFASGALTPVGQEPWLSHSVPDGSALLLGSANAAQENNLSIIRLEPDAYYPEALVTGYETVPANFWSVSDSGDNRFVAYALGSSADESIDVVDVVLGRRHGFIVDPWGQAKGAQFAPSGYYFHAYFRGDDATQSLRGYSKVTASGVAPLVPFAEGAGTLTFTRDGSRLYYTKESANGAIELWTIPFPAPAEVVPLDVPGGVLHHLPFSLEAPYSILVQFTMDGSNDVFYRVEPDGSSTRATDPARNAVACREFAGGILAIYDDGDTRELVWHDAGGLGSDHAIVRVPDDADHTIRLEFIGDHVDYFVSGERHLVGVDAAGVHDVVISDVEMNEYCDAVAGSLLVAKRADESLVVVDLAEPTARILGTLPLTDGMTRTVCPMKHRTESAFLYQQRADTGATVFEVDVDGTIVGTPRRVTDVSGYLYVFAFDG